jgi:hypothetical protein
MRVVDAGVHDSDGHARAAGGHRPRLGSVDIGVGRSCQAVDRLAGVLQGPELCDGWVVGLRERVKADVRLGVADTRIPLEGRSDPASLARGHRDEAGSNRNEPLLRLRSEATKDAGLGAGSDVALEADDDLRAPSRSRRGSRRSRSQRRKHRCQSRRRRDEARPHKTSVGSGVTPYKAPTGELSERLVRAS